MIVMMTLMIAMATLIVYCIIKIYVHFDDTFSDRVDRIQDKIGESIGDKFEDLFD